MSSSPTPQGPIDPDEWIRAKVAEGNGPVEAFKIPAGKGRLLLLAGGTDARMRDIAQCLLLARWGAQQDRAEAREDGTVSISSGFIGITAFTKRGVLRKAERAASSS